MFVQDSQFDNWELGRVDICAPSRETLKRKCQLGHIDLLIERELEIPALYRH